MSPSRQPLLSAGFLERLEALREAVFRFERQGELRSRSSGETPEFDAHRSYGMGDDPRYVDWNVYARLERLLVKMYVMDDETQVSIFVDVSRSMRQPGKDKLRAAARAAAAFSYLAVSGSHSLTIGAFSDKVLAARGPYRSQHQFPSVVEFLNALPEGEGTDLGRSLGEYLAVRRESTFLVVISDLLQERPLLDDLARLGKRAAGLHVVQVLDPSEMVPPGGGELLVEDAEASGQLAVFLGDDLREVFGRRLRGYLDEIARSCRARGIPHTLLYSTDDLEGALLDHLVSVAGSAVRTKG